MAGSIYAATEAATLAAWSLAAAHSTTRPRRAPRKRGLFQADSSRVWERQIDRGPDEKPHHGASVWLVHVVHTGGLADVRCGIVGSKTDGVTVEANESQRVHALSELSTQVGGTQTNRQEDGAQS